MSAFRALVCLFLMVFASAPVRADENPRIAAVRSQFNAIRGEILAWLDSGSGKNLLLPPDLSYDDYLAKIRPLFLPEVVAVDAVTTLEEEATSDPERKVVVAGVFKTCRGFVSDLDHRRHILCNVERFEGTPIAARFRLVHHEYAGLARVEKNEGASSDYGVSDQMTDFLAAEAQFKLSPTRKLDSKTVLLRDILSQLKLALSKRTGEVPFKTHGIGHALRFQTDSFVYGDEQGARCPARWVITQSINDGAVTRNWRYEIDLGGHHRGTPWATEMRKLRFDTEFPVYHARIRSSREDELDPPTVVFDRVTASSQVETYELRRDGASSSWVHTRSHATEPRLISISIPSENDLSQYDRLNSVQRAIQRFSCLFRHEDDWKFDNDYLAGDCRGMGIRPICAHLD